MAVQLAALRGATGIATASAAHQDLLRELGALPITYGPGLADRVSELRAGESRSAGSPGTDEAINVSLLWSRRAVGS